MDSTFLSVIRAAHREGDLSNRRAIKQALLYENYRDSGPALQRQLREHPLWSELDPNDDSPGVKMPPLVLDDAHNIGEKPTHRVARLQRQDRVIKEVATPGDLLTLDDDRLPAAVAQKLLSDLCERFLRKLELVWVFLPAANDGEDLPALLLDLGLYYVLGREPDAHYLYVELEPLAVRKPNWLDAKLAWYFDVVPEDMTRGWTRSLRTGERGYPEWVAKGAQIGSKVSARRIASTKIPKEPTARFWIHHRERLTAARLAPDGNEP